MNYRLFSGYMYGGSVYICTLFLYIFAVFGTQIGYACEAFGFIVLSSLKLHVRTKFPLLF